MRVRKTRGRYLFDGTIVRFADFPTRLVIKFDHTRSLQYRHASEVEPIPVSGCEDKYPTVFAYEKACEALNKKTSELDKALKRISELEAELASIESAAKDLDTLL